ncbi:MAG: stalk domain-containing protein [Armatimonadota bacterium]|nr:stalk domain-containing protein [Armatimonadota bacterium]
MTRRRSIIWLLTVAIACAAPSAPCAPQNAKRGLPQKARGVDFAHSPVVLVDGRLVTLATVSARDGQTLVWIRDLEKLGWGRVEPRRDGSMVLRSGAIAIRFTNGSARTMINKLAVDAPAPPKIVAGKFMVPLQFVCNSLGYSFGLTARPVANITTASVARPAAQPTPSQQTVYRPPRYQPHQSKPANRYRPDATILQSQRPQGGNNRITGRVTFAGAPTGGVRLRLINPKGALMPADKSASTDNEGRYSFAGLPDGEYRVYAYVGDNPDYFNRASNVISLSNGSEGKPADVALGRVLHPLNPPVGGKVTPVDGKAEFTCSTCQSAAKYSFSIVESSSKTNMTSAASTEPLINMDISSLQPGREYEWRVTAVDDKGEFVGGNPGAGMPAWTFSLAAP